MLIQNLKSDFQKILKKFQITQKPKNTIFVPCIPSGILFQIKIFFVEFTVLPSNYAESVFIILFNINLHNHNKPL